MNKSNKLFTIIFFVLMTVFVTACGGVTAAAKSTTIITSPPSNSTFREGDTIAVTSTSTDQAGIAKVELLVDGAVVRTDPSPTAQVSFTVIQNWVATPGTHTLAVHAINTQNVVNEPASITISVMPRTTTLTPTVTAPLATVTVPPVSANRSCTNNATFVTDVTVPDGTAMTPGQTFNKVWRIRNTGTCTWGTGEELAFVRGEAMTPVRAITVPATAPGNTADIAVNMTAPTAAGSHTGEWRMRGKDGTLFGVTLRVVINVTNPAANCPFTPVIESFTISPTTIVPGQSATLSWGAVVGAERAEIDNGIGGVATPGSIQVTPSTTTTYTMTAICSNKVRTAQVTVNVVAPTATSLPLTVTIATNTPVPATATPSVTPTP